MEEEILKILSEIKPGFDFTDSTDFIEDGLLDSFDVVTMVSMLDETFGISIDGLDVIPDNFVSAKTIMDTVIKNGGAA